MASDYPGGLDSFDTIASDKKTSDAVGGRTHRDMHNDLGDAIEAVQAELGTDPAGSFATVKARLDAIGTVGTGSPEGVVTAAPGSTWLQTNSTTDVKGWLRWVKASGTGNTGWVAGPEADTGWRNVSGSVINGWGINANANEALQVRRVGSQVYWRWGGATAGSNANFIAAIAGFRSYPHYGYDIPSGSGAETARVVVVSYSSGLSMSTSSFSQYTTIGYPTDDTWPSSLPGVAA